MSFFGQKKISTGRQTQTGMIAAAVAVALGSRQIGDAGLARAMLSAESLSDSQRCSFDSVTSDLALSIESITDELKLGSVTSTAQRQAAIAAGLLGADMKSALSHQSPALGISAENYSVVPSAGLADSFERRTYSAEAYDDRDNQQSLAFSVTYNYQCARQDEFAEAFFPTVVVTPDNVGLTITVRIMNVLNDFQRNISGALDNYNKKNIIRAVTDPTILKNELTRVVPVVRAQSLANFVDPAIIPAAALLLEGESINSAPLAVGKKFSLLALSQTDTLLANGVMDVSDSLEPAIQLGALYIQVPVPSGAAGGTTQDILKFNVRNLPGATFTPSLQNNTRIMTVNFDTSSALMSAVTKRLDGSNLSTLASIVANNLIVRLNLVASGNVNVETSQTQIFGNNVSVYSVQDATGAQLDLVNNATAAAIVAIFAKASIVGYDLVAYRSNLNRRQRGQLVETTYYRQAYAVPLRSPVTSVHPVTNDGQEDAGEVATLVTVTHIRTSNAAVTALIDASTMLRDFIDARDAAGNSPDILGVGRLLVVPKYGESTLDMLTAVDSINSSQRTTDMSFAIVNKIRDIGYRLWRDSEYKAAADASFGGIAPKPTLLVGTDPVLSQYINVAGDLRTAGGQFDMKLVTTLDNRVSGKVFITLGDFSGDVNAGPNPLHFGCTAWKPEMVVRLPISRGGQTSKELTVQPSFLHVVNCPILYVLTVVNVPDVLLKVSRFTHSV